MTDVRTMRRALLRLYGEQWRKKVLKFSDEQVAAVYFRFLSEGKIKP